MTTESDPTNTKINHSGNLPRDMREIPINPSSIPLERARHGLNIPTSASGLFGAETEVDEEVDDWNPNQDPKHKGIKKWAIGAVGAVAATAAGLALFGGGLTGPKDAVAESPAPGVVAGALANPTPETSSTPLAQASPEATTNPNIVKGENEFDISNANYTKIVESLKINLPRDASTEAILTAISKNLTTYYSGGDNESDLKNHMIWRGTLPDDVGWNRWSANLYTKAIMEGMFAPGYETMDPARSSTDNLKSWKVATNGIWANTTMAHETPYKVSVDFTLDRTIVHAITATDAAISVVGTFTYSSNAAESPSAASNKISLVTPDSVPNTFITATYTDSGWQISQLYSQS